MKRLTEKDIVHEAGEYWVGRESNGYRVYKNGVTHAPVRPPSSRRRRTANPSPSPGATTSPNERRASNMGQTNWPQVDCRLNDTIKAINDQQWKEVGRLLADTGNPIVAAVLILKAIQSASCIMPADVVLNNVDKF